ncbi:MAG: Uma2 family endonuclease, partial [Bryobacteraceae bacterium]
MATLPRTVTYDEWLAMPEIDEGREEVVNGDVQFLPPPKLPHADVISELLFTILAQVDRKLVKVLPAEFGLIIRRDPLTSRSPDLAVFWKAGMVFKDGYCHSAPDLVIEVISSSETRSRKLAKLADYAGIGVPEAWLLDPRRRT